MTWIRVIPFDEDETLRRAGEAQRKLYRSNTRRRPILSTPRPMESSPRIR